jgi:Transposase zinc-binding domain
LRTNSPPTHACGAPAIYYSNLDATVDPRVDGDAVAVETPALQGSAQRLQDLSLEGRQRRDPSAGAALASTVAEGDCRGRSFCPSCEKKKQLLWAEWLRDEVLAEVAHRHVVLTSGSGSNGLLGGMQPEAHRLVVVEQEPRIPLRHARPGPHHRGRRA